MAKNAISKALSQDDAGSDELGHFNHHFSITMELEKHPLMMALIAAAILIVIYYLYKGVASGHQAAGSATQPGAPTTGSTTGQPVAPINVYPPPGSTTTIGGTLPPGPPGGQSNPLQAILGKGGNGVTFGQTMVVNGTTFTLGPGSAGVWGVPGIWRDINSWNSVPIGPGQKQLIFSR